MVPDMSIEIPSAEPSIILTIISLLLLFGSLAVMYAGKVTADAIHKSKLCSVPVLLGSVLGIAMFVGGAALFFYGAVPGGHAQPGADSFKEYGVTELEADESGIGIHGGCTPNSIEREGDYVWTNEDGSTVVGKMIKSAEQDGSCTYTLIQEYP